MANKLFLKFLVASLLCHLGLIYLLSGWKIPQQNESVEIEWIMEPSPEPNQREHFEQPPPAKRAPQMPVITKQKSKTGEPGTLLVQEPVQTPVDTMVPDTITNSFWINPLVVAKQNMSLDSAQQKPFAPYSKSLPPLTGTAPPGIGGDRIDQEIYRRSVGHPPTVPTSNLLLKTVQFLKNKLTSEKPPALTFIPTKSQLAAFRTIWENQAATDQDIYSGLDSSINITAEGLRAELSRLERLGFLERKIVSPRNELTIMTPVGSKAIEMSSTNRRNRIYEYRTQIPQEQMLRFLNAALYQVTHGLKREFYSSLDSLALVKDLQSKILFLSARQNRE